MKSFANLAAIAGGLALFAAFPPLGIWPLAIVGVALLVGALEGRSWFGSFWIGTLFGFAFFFPLFDWARIASGVVIAQIGLSVAEALYIGAMAIVWQGLMRGRLGSFVTLRALTLPLVWIAFEQLRGTWPFGGMPWGTLGFSQVDSPLVRLAPWGSVMLVGFFVVAIAVLLEWCVKTAIERRLGNAIIAVACGGALLYAPMFLPLGARADSYITAGFVQGIVPDEATLGPDESRALTVTENLVKSTDNLPGDPDVVFWPESASDRDPRTSDDARDLIDQASQSLGVPLVLGTQSYPGENRYNEYVVWMPDGTIAGSYSKQHPIPFGEYMPYKDFFRNFTDAVDLVTIDMLAGTEPAVLDVELANETLTIASPICFEVAETQIVAEAVRGGAELIIVPTNNASFGESAESAQQFDMTRFRAIEHGRTAVQVSTVGVSGVVEPNGVTREVTEPWTEDARTVRVGLRSELTFAARFSQFLLIGTYIAGGALSVLGLINIVRHRLPRQ
ncbi:MAG: apolipoprotein N-acyltransferase [Ancrocorticia sp.]|uniref:apolipoprotein N-acyltransferase n=1 Tax=Ancrocorticia sp. TaxID=2593684 RepID=UPI003F92F45C